MLFCAVPSTPVSACCAFVGLPFTLALDEDVSGLDMQHGTTVTLPVLSSLQGDLWSRDGPPWFAFTVNE